MEYRIEAGKPAFTLTVEGVASALGRRAVLQLVDLRRRADARAALSADPVHSAIGEIAAAHLRGVGFRVGIHEPYQHFQFVGRADVVSWDLEVAAFLHIHGYAEAATSLHTEPEASAQA